jgi:DNA helicase-2/ATP-dependent DNA helicase PcrA
LEIELAKRKIPFIKYGGVKLNDAAHIKDVLAHLKVIENPRDVVAWQRILLLLEGLGPRTVQEIVAWMQTSEDPFGMDNTFTTPRYLDGLKRLLALLKAIQAPDITVSQQIAFVVEYYTPILERVHLEDADKRLQDLNHFVGLTLNYATRGDLLTALALEPIERTAVDTEASQKDEPPLVLSTIHSAKGLEFHSVFLIQAIDGVIPSGYSLNSEAALDEELRLLYVALTRAAQNLFISYPILANRGSFGDYFAKPSRFLENLPKTLAEPWQLVEEQPKILGSH